MMRKIPEEQWPLPSRTVCDSPDELAAAVESLPEYGEVTIVEHEGKRVAAIIPMDDLELYQRLFAEHEDRLDHAAAEAAIAEAGGHDQMMAHAVPLEELLRKLESKRSA